MPDPEAIQKSKKHNRSIGGKWDFDAEVKLVKEARKVGRGKTWEDVGRTFGVSMSAAFNKYMRMEAAHRAFVAAEGQ